jgi:arylsulfatase A-like enzyme
VCFKTLAGENSSSETSILKPNTHPNSSRPNIIFILSDDHRWDCFGAMGNRQIVTPNLDALAKSGIVFTHGTVAVPQCCPSRAALLTGLFSPQNGYYSNKNCTKAAERGFAAPTAMTLLQKSGYHTCLVGKWHLKPEPWKVGFDEIRAWMPHGADTYENPKLAFGKKVKVKEVVGHVTEIFSDEAIHFLRDYVKEPAKQPFFLWLAYTAPHTPQKPVPHPFNDLYTHLKRDHRPPGFPADVAKPGPWAQYYAAITHLDEHVGRVLKEVKDQGLEENTVIVFLGDNGWMMGSHGRYGKNLPDDESTRVPFIVRAPQKWQGWSGSSNALVSSVDLAPTWLALAGVPIPETWPGSSMVSLLKDQTPKIPFRPYSFSLFKDEKEFCGSAFRMVRTQDYKYILRPKRTEKELKALRKKLAKVEDEKDRKMPNLNYEQVFDLRNDPHELKDIADESASSEKLHELRALLRGELIRTQDPAVRWFNTSTTVEQKHAVEDDADFDAEEWTE